MGPPYKRTAMQRESASASMTERLLFLRLLGSAMNWWDLPQRSGHYICAERAQLLRRWHRKVLVEINFR